MLTKHEWSCCIQNKIARFLFGRSYCKHSIKAKLSTLEMYFPSQKVVDTPAQNNPRHSDMIIPPSGIHLTRGGTNKTVSLSAK